MSFVSRRIKKSATFKISAKIDEVFPLLCPRRELDWIDGWKYDMIYSESGYNEEGCIFKSKLPYGVEVVWTCINYDKKNNVVEFLNYSSGLFVQRFNIKLLKDTDGYTNQTINLTITSLSKKGNKFINKFSDESFNQSMNGMKLAINHYLKTGNIFKNNDSKKRHKLFLH